MTDSIVFDLDGTLIESEKIWRDVRRDFVFENGGRWRDDAQHTMMGMRSDEWACYMHDVLEVSLSPNTIKNEIVERVASRLSKRVPILPGADCALERLASGFQLGLATSSAMPVAQAVLDATGWRPYFESVVSADDVDRGKPAPDVYLRALRSLNAKPAQAAAVEDSANGIRSAHAAKLPVVAIPNREFPPDANTLALASSILSDLDELNAATFRELIDGAASGPRWRAGAVMLAISVKSPYGVLFVERARHLRRHPGEVGLPGGAADRIDCGDSEKTALRELSEELNIGAEHVTVVGRLAPLTQRRNRFVISPIVAVLDAKTTFSIDGDEIVGVFAVPLRSILEREGVYEERELSEKLGRRMYALDYEGRHIWGFTGRILKAFAQTWSQPDSRLRASVEEALGTRRF